MISFYATFLNVSNLSQLIIRYLSTLPFLISQYEETILNENIIQ